MIKKIAKHARQLQKLSTRVQIWTRVEKVNIANLAGMDVKSRLSMCATRATAFYRFQWRSPETLANLSSRPGVYLMRDDRESYLCRQSEGSPSRVRTLIPTNAPGPVSCPSVANVETLVTIAIKKR
jgi:hypothetical protein